jgi:hypothetical protein
MAGTKVCLSRCGNSNSKHPLSRTFSLDDRATILIDTLKEETSMPLIRYAGLVGLLLLPSMITGCLGPTTLPTDNIRGTRVASPEFVDGPAPLRTPSPARAIGSERFEDSLTGGEVFQMYCASCHNRRPMSERPFASYQNVAAHMRTRGNLTGKEYEKLVAWMRRVQDAPLPNPDTAPSPKRSVFAQPIPELRGEAPAAGDVTPAQLPDKDQTKPGP